MERLFLAHEKRSTISLNGAWQFRTDPEKKGEQEKWFAQFPVDAQTVVVPSCWNNEFGLYEYTGVAWYSREFIIDCPHLLIEFGAVTGYARVYLDGQLLGDHYGGFTAFRFSVTDATPGRHRLTVLVDNTSNENTIPLPRVDWYPYGGIIRGVEVSALPHTWIADYRIDYTLDASLTSAIVSASITLENPTGQTEETFVRLMIGDQLVASGYTSVDKTACVLFENMSMTDIRLWDIDDPHLYSIRVEIDRDDAIDRIGFRRIEIREQHFFLNGRELYLKGVNRHEEHPDWGFAFPAKLMKRDLDIIKNMGCNTIRGSHYPNSQTFLDYLDQEGILFWSEIPMWGFPEISLQNPVILERGLAMHSEMVAQYIHHPSIIIWGLHNEIDTRCEAGYALTKTFAEHLRRLDNSRLLTFATMYYDDDICLPLVDFISINYYAGWYVGKIEDWSRFIERVKEKRNVDGLSAMPLVISEFGAASMYGHHTFEDNKWSEEYQMHLFEYALKLFQDDPDIAGHYIWQFCDIRSNMGNDRARGFNNKGIVNEYRKPKQAYHSIRLLQQER